MQIGKTSSALKDVEAQRSADKTKLTFLRSDSTHVQTHINKLVSSHGTFQFHIYLAVIFIFYVYHIMCVMHRLLGCSTAVAGGFHNLFINEHHYSTRTAALLERCFVFCHHFTFAAAGRVGFIYTESRKVVGSSSVFFHLPAPCWQTCFRPTSGGESLIRCIGNLLFHFY